MYEEDIERKRAFYFITGAFSIFCGILIPHLFIPNGILTTIGIVLIYLAMDLDER